MNALVDKVAKIIADRVVEVVVPIIAAKVVEYVAPKIDDVAKALLEKAVDALDRNGDGQLSFRDIIPG